MTNRQFIELVAQMRAAQKQGGPVMAINRIERQVDEVLDQMAGPEQQGALFEVGRRGRSIGRLDAMIAVKREEEMRRVAEENGR